MADYFPGADRTSQWFGDAFPGRSMNPSYICLHTTEGNGWTGYAGGGSSPHFTVLPDEAAQTLRIRQHMRLDRTARALIGAVNNDRCVQIELVGTSGWASPENPGRPYTVPFMWPSAPDWALSQLGGFLTELAALTGVPADVPFAFVSWKQGNRQSRASFDSHRGICGHQHVPDNDHSDPGALPMARILAGAAVGGGGGVAPHPDPAPAWDGHSFPGASAFVLGQSHPAVTLLGQRLIAHGYGQGYRVGPGPVFTAVDRDACAAFQRAQGWTGSGADGIPGPQTWARLMTNPVRQVSLSLLIAAAKADGARPQGGTTAGSVASVEIVEDALVRLGYLDPKYGKDGSFGTSSVAAYARWQRDCGAVGKGADGIPGRETLTKLGARFGFTVVA